MLILRVALPNPARNFRTGVQNFRSGCICDQEPSRCHCWVLKNQTPQGFNLKSCIWHSGPGPYTESPSRYGYWAQVGDVIQCYDLCWMAEDKNLTEDQEVETVVESIPESHRQILKLREDFSDIVAGGAKLAAISNPSESEIRFLHVHKVILKASAHEYFMKLYAAFQRLQTLPWAEGILYRHLSESIGYGRSLIWVYQGYLQQLDPYIPLKSQARVYVDGLRRNQDIRDAESRIVREATSSVLGQLFIDLDEQ